VNTGQAAVVRLAESYDADGPYRGQCGLCGGPDARHRVVEAWTDLWLAGESFEDIAREWERPDVLAVADAIAATLAWEVEWRRSRLNADEREADEWNYWPVTA
jgi:hypothetical protein